MIYSILLWGLLFLFSFGREVEEEPCETDYWVLMLSLCSFPFPVGIKLSNVFFIFNIKEKNVSLNLNVVLNLQPHEL